MDGESSFQFYIGEQISRGKPYIATNPSMEIAQSNHDVEVLVKIRNFFNSGIIKPKLDTNNITECKVSRSVSRYVNRNTEEVMKFVDKYPMFTMKHLDYLDWKKRVEMKSEMSYKTQQGLQNMKEIKAGINRGRNN